MTNITARITTGTISMLPEIATPSKREVRLTRNLNEIICQGKTSVKLMFLENTLLHR